MVLEGGPGRPGRTEKVLDADEEKLTNGIVKVTARASGWSTW